MSVLTCDHLKEDGVFCGSPALKGRNYCYFHLNLRGRRLKAARARRRGDNPPLNLPFPEDMHAVQVSLAEILWGLAEGRIEHKTAGLMLYTLQQASTNLNHTARWQGEREAVENSRPLRALNFPDFEQRFGLPNDIDLDADPAPLGAPPLSPALGDRACPEPVEGVGVADPAPLGAPPLSPAFGDSVGAGCHVPAQLERGFSTSCKVAEAAPEVHTSPDRVPFPEDELKQLHVTKLEEMEFFLYKGNFYPLTEEREHELLVDWLRERRSEELEVPALREQRKKSNESLVAHLAQSKAEPALAMGDPQSTVGDCGDADADEAA